jgi:hypothetical protein
MLIGFSQMRRASDRFRDCIRNTLDPRLSPAFLRLMTGGRKA